MTTIIDGYNSIIEHFIDNWNNETPVAVPNQYFEIDTDEEFVRINVKPMTGQFASVSNGGFSDRLIRHEGEVIVQVFTKAGSGFYRSNQLCQLSLDILKQDIEGLELFDPSIRDIGEDGEGFYQKQVVFTYRYGFLG